MEQSIAPKDDRWPACEAAASTTGHRGEVASSRPPAEVPLSNPDALLVGLLAAVGAACGGFTGAAAGAAGAACAAAYSLFGEDTSALGAAAGVLGSIVGGAVGGAFCGAVGGAVGGAAGASASAGPGFWLVSDAALATLGCATGGVIGCNFHRTVGAVGGATGAAFGALVAREFTSRLVQSLRDLGLNGDVEQLMQPLQRFIEQRDRRTDALDGGCSE